MEDIEMEKAEPSKAISFTIGNPAVEYLRLEEGGKVYLRGTLVEDDKEAYTGFSSWLKAAQEETARMKEANDRFHEELDKRSESEVEPA